MMAAINKPLGLIGYNSEAGITEGRKLRYTGRMKFYTVLLVLLSGLLAILLLSRKDIDGTIIRTKGTLYFERGTDSLANLFNIRIINKTLDEIPVTLKLVDPGVKGTIQLVGASTIHLGKEEQANGSFFVVLPRDQVRSRKMKLHIGLFQGNEQLAQLTTNFAGPFGKFTP